MAVKSYVLIETEVGTAKSVAEHLKDIHYRDASVMQVDTVTGPFDVVAQIEAEDLNRLGGCITEAIQTITGVKRTTTCLTLMLD